MRRDRIFERVAFALVVGTLSTYAATNYWDNNGDAAGFGAAGGTWGLEQKWSADSTGVSLPSVTSTTADDDLFFGSRDAGLADGAITVEGTNQAFRAMTFGDASGSITLSNGTLNLGAPLTRIAVNNVSNTIASALGGTHGLHKFSYPPLANTNFLSEVPTVLFTNATLAGYVHAGGILHGGWVAKLPANAYHFTNDGATATWQFQVLDGIYTKCVKVELAQAGADITGRALYAKYLAYQQLGFNFDSGSSQTGTVATNSTANGYGVAQTALLLTKVASEPFLTGTSETVVSNAVLAEIASVAASLAGGSVSDAPAKLTPYYFSNNGATATVQMQAFNGNYTKCLKLEFTQSGSNLAGRVLYAKYYNAVGVNAMGLDFDSNGTANSIATGFALGGYGACQLRFEGARRLRLAGVNTYAGSTVIDSGVLEIADGGQLGAGAYAGAITNAGLLLYNSSANQTLSGPIAGAGSLVKESTGKTPRPSTYASFLTATAATVFYNKRLADCIGASGVMGGTSVNGGSPAPATAYKFTNDGTNATWQLRIYDDVYTKCVKIALAQTGLDIAGRVVYAKYISGNNLEFDFDEGGTGNTIATSYATGGYGAAETTITLYTHSALTLSGTNTYAGGTFVNRGLLEASGSANALPSSGGITVNAGGDLLLKAGALNVGNTGGVGNGNPITVNSGGTLTLFSAFNAGYSRLITLNGGTLTSLYTENNDCANYINNLALMNGARVTGYKIRVGYHSAASITVSGTSPCSLEAGLNMVNTANRALTLNVADVTGSAAADLSIPGVIRDYDTAGFAGMPIVKAGAGTVSLSGANTHVGPITVTAGTLALGATNTLNTGNSITLNGGTLDMGACTNTVGTLAVLTNSVLALGPGRLAFADSSAVAWTNTLTLTGTLERYTLRFGTTSTALTPQQAGLIVWNGKPVHLRSDGYVSPFDRGTLILLH